ARIAREQCGGLYLATTKQAMLSITFMGCPSISVYQCTHCDGLFCSTCCETSTCDSDDVGILTIGSWFCDAPACIEAESLYLGTSVDVTKNQHARRRRPHPGRLVTEEQLRQLLLLGRPQQQEEAYAALDESKPRWRRLRARERCAGFLKLDKKWENA